MTAAVVRLHGADPSADGVARVDSNELEAKLGPTAVHVWTILCRLRDEYGCVHVTRTGIGRARGFVRVKERAIRKALCRLRSAALVRDVGFRWMDVGVRAKHGTRRVFVREVYGERVLRNVRRRTYNDWQEQPPSWEYVVPTPTKQWLQTARGWGGKRDGAGRRPTQRNHSKKNQEGPVPKESRGADDLVSNVMSSDHKARAYSFGVGGAPSAPTVVEGVGVVLGNGSSRQPFSLSESCDGVPPYPDLAKVPPATVPSPPLLSETMSDTELAGTLVAVYRAAVSRRTGKPCHVMSRGSVAASRHYKTLVAAARLLIEHEIPPAAWVLFMCDVHWSYKQNAKSKRPALLWVYAPKRINRWRGWYGREASTYGGGRLIHGQRLRLLLRRYESMRRELHRSPDADVAKIVAQHFPVHDSYAQAVAAARQEAASLRERYELRVARGEVLWG